MRIGLGSATSALKPLALALAAGTMAAGSAFAEPLTLTIIHVNDVDRMEEDDGRGGMARIVGAINTVRADADHVLVTNAGDFISPSLLSGFDQGAHMIDLINQAGFDLITLGNHEFDFGPEVAGETASALDIPVISANIVDPAGAPVPGTEPTWTTTFGDYTIGVVGLTTAGTMVKSSPGDMQFLDPVDVAAQRAAELRDAGADLVIALAHTDLSEDRALLDAGDVDLILSGDDHLLTAWYDGDVALVESASQGDYVTVVELALDRVESRGEMRFVWSPSFRTIDTVTIEPDPALTESVQVYLDQLSAELDIEIGTTETQLDSRRASVRTQETAIGNLIADAMRTAVDADIAITNGGGIRADRVYEPGTMLTRRDILSELPFGNKTVLLEVSGADVLAALENGFSRVEDVGGRFPQISGLTVSVDLSAEPGSRVQSAMVGEAPLDPAATYLLATNDFMARGGDGYAVFSDAPRVIDENAGTLMATHVIDFVEAAGSVSPAVEGRIVQ